MNKLLRTFTVVFLAFGWLFIAPMEAHSDDPIYIATQEILELNKKVDSLVFKDDFKVLIGISESKLQDAINARDTRDQAYQDYEDALEVRDLAIEQNSLVQSNVDGQTVTADLALTNKNNAKDQLDVANINLQTAQQTINSAGSKGWQFTAYTLNSNRTP